VLNELSRAEVMVWAWIDLSFRSNSLDTPINPHYHFTDLWFESKTGLNELENGVGNANERSFEL
jgi:hypothetical protein